MARQLFIPGKQGFGIGTFNLTTDVLAAALILSAYTLDPTHQYMSSITAANIAASADVQLAGKACKTLTTISFANGILDADDVTFSNVTAAQTIKAVVLFRQVGGDFSTLNNDNLIAWFDDYTNLPLLTSGGDVIVQWSNATSKIMSF